MIVLVGFMGAGKTTVGRIVADRLGLPFVDSDLVMEERLGRPIREVFTTEGEAHFREVEHSTIDELLQGPPAVLSVGGGALGDPRTRARLRRATVVYLHVSYDEARARVQHDADRPMLHRPGLDELFVDRHSVYLEVATIRVETTGRGLDAVAEDVVSGLGPSALSR